MSKRSKACEISQKVKTEVWLRDSCSCIYCKKWVPKSCANAHFIKRSQRRHGNRRKHSYIVSRLSLRIISLTKYTIIRGLYRKLFKEHLWGKLE